MSGRPASIDVPVDVVVLAVVLQRRSAHRLRLTYLAEPLAASAGDLEALLPEHVAAASAARALGVTPQALHRWRARGALPGLRAADLLEAVDRVLYHRGRGNSRALAKVLRPKALRPPRSASAAPPAARRPSS